MLQRWESLTFLHWRYDPQVIRALLPSHIELDTFDGSAWVALTPFVLRGLRPPFTPPLPWISRFPETNVRTYVRGADGERGVWFFTLEASRLAAVLGARSLYHLPYRWATMRVRHSGNTVEYRSRRRSPFGAGTTDITVAPGSPVVAGDFDNFLTARYRLYTVFRDKLFYAPIDHPPWKLHTARLLHLEADLIQQSGVPKPLGAPVVHYSRNLAVRVGRLRRYVPPQPDTRPSVT